MDYFEYKDLTPIDNVENGDKYIEALSWAFQNKKVKNIALTGPYGAGKSSVIETFLLQDDKKNSKWFHFHKDTIRKKSLKISMATFFKGKDLENSEAGEKIEVDADEVEKGILKQLFYKVKPSKIPQSRYRKIHKIKFFPVMIHIFVAMVLIAFSADIFASKKYGAFVRAINNFLSIKNPSNVRTYSFIGALFFVTSGVIAYLYCTVISKFRIKEVKLPSDTTVQSGSEEADSVFNKNLDEIMYFFESTGYRIVFFEDLDRLDDPKIFVHLRELNNLLNNDDSIKRKPIVFVYAVRDDIFSKEDRTKFFDFIIPIIPVINSTNSGEILLQRFQEAKEKGIEHNISQEFVLDVSPYISDMRVLQNIYNEFVIYKDTLRTTQELSLSDEQMLAMIVFKNIYPSDFADIQGESGVVKDAFNDKRRFVSVKKQEIQTEIDSYSTTIERYQADSMKSVREIKYAMFGELMGEFGIPESLRDNYWEDISVDTVMDDGFNLAQLLDKNYTEISYYYGKGYSTQTSAIRTEVLESYIERWREINRIRKNGQQEIQEELQQLRMQHHALSGVSLARILEDYLPEEVLSEKVQRNKLLVFLLRRGYIDEKYANYINYFKGTSITKGDMNFILSVKNREPLTFDYQLTKTPMVIQRLVAKFMPTRKVWGVMQKDYLEGRALVKPTSSWTFKDVNSERGTEEFIGLGFDKRIFQKPKPLGTIKRCTKLCSKSNDDIVIDFFSGSATTAHAVMQLNAEDNGHRKFIMVQLPEKCDEKSEAYKAGYKNICEIGKERIRRAGEKIKSESPLTTQNLDVGFRVLKLDDTNMKDIYYAPDDYSQDLLARLESNIKEDRTDLDLLFGCLLDWGLPLAMPYSSEQIDGCIVHTYNDGDLIACFNENVPDSVVKEIARRQPLRVVFRDSSFANSPAKINVTEIFKLLAPDTRVKVI